MCTRSKQVTSTITLTSLALALFAGGTSAQLHVQLHFGENLAVAGDEMGTSVAILGDLDGDGKGEVAVGTPGDSTNGVDAGAVYVADGQFGNVLYVIRGTHAGDRCGESIANLGDVDLDGFDDLLVGFPGEDFNGNDTGRARVYSGDSGLVLYTRIGPQAGARFGAAVAAVGDTNGDGRPDFLVGAPDYDVAGLSGQSHGYAGLFSGAPFGTPMGTFTGTQSFEQLGYAVGGAGDVDADGVADFAIGAPGHDVLFTFNTGRVTVYSGATHGLLGSHVGSAFDSLGFALAPVGDTDLDGVPELLAGAPGHASNRGAVQLLEGPLLSQVWQLEGPQLTTNDRYGSSVSGLGDFDRDGHVDMLVGAPMEGTSFGGLVQVVSGADGLPAQSIYGAAAGDGFGSAVAGADLNGNDWPDVFVGVPLSDAEGADSGYAIAYDLLTVQPNLLLGGPGIAALSVYGTPLVTGGQADMALTFAPPSSPAYLLLSLEEDVVPFKGGFLVPEVATALIVSLVTDAQGEILIPSLPGGGGPLIVYAQYVIKNAMYPLGFGMSNAVAIEYLP
ncbi:MAG: FG-GAP repeat protein [Planctomycetes bacterium]|nr:FG-GAP repeat protein [Planctomycetota bacterium]